MPAAMISDDDIRAVLDDHQNRLLALPHVVATGIVDGDGDGDGPAIAIYVDTLDPDAALPATLRSTLQGADVCVPTAVRLMGAMTF